MLIIENTELRTRGTEFDLLESFRYTNKTMRNINTRHTCSIRNIHTDLTRYKTKREVINWLKLLVQTVKTLKNFKVCIQSMKNDIGHPPIYFDANEYAV